MMKEKIRIGCVGTLHDHSYGKLDCLRAFPEVFDIVGFVPESDEQYEAIKEHPTYKGLKRLTEDGLYRAGVDAVIIEGHEFELVDAAQRAIDRGVHVHMDKPAGTDIIKFEKLLNSAKEKGLTLQMAYMYRYNSEVMKIKELINEGKLGEIYSIEAHMNCEHTPEKRAWLSQFKGGMMFFLGCHLIDLIVMLQGIPDEVIPLNTKTMVDGVDTEDFGMAVLKYKHGVSFAKTCAAEVNGFARRQLVVCGTKGTVELKPIEGYDENLKFFTASVTAFKEKEPNWKKTGESFRSKSFDRYDTLMMDFAAMVRGEKKNPFTYEYELAVHKVILSACGYDIDFKA